MCSSLKELLLSLQSVNCMGSASHHISADLNYQLFEYNLLSMRFTSVIATIVYVL